MKSKLFRVTKDEDETLAEFSLALRQTLGEKITFNGMMRATVAVFRRKELYHDEEFRRLCVKYSTEAYSNRKRVK